MTGWRRELNGAVCGRCGTHIPSGDPVFFYASSERKRALKRCAKCAGEPVPTDLPPLTVRDVVPIQSTPLTKKPSRPAATSIRQLATDWKLAQSGGDH